MSQEYIHHPIRLALNQNRLCISMEVLHSIGSPQYIQMFVSRNQKILYIRGLKLKAEHSIKVPPRVYDDPLYDYRLNKAAFAEAICAVTGWDSQGCYRMNGSCIAEDTIAFHFNKAERIDRIEL